LREQLKSEERKMAWEFRGRKDSGRKQESEESALRSANTTQFIRNGA